MQPNHESSNDTQQFIVTFDDFEGPLDALLGLIAARKLDVTTMSLAEVTDDFLAYTAKWGDNFNLEEASHFVVVAATLLDWKTYRLLPGEDTTEEEDVALLESRDLLFARLLQYKAFKDVSHALGAAVERRSSFVARRPALEDFAVKALPELVITFSGEDLAKAYASLLSGPPPPEQVGVQHVHASPILLEDQVALMQERVQHGACTFTDLIADAESSLMVAVRFLALLELYRKGLIMMDQPGTYADISVDWCGQECA